MRGQLHPRLGAAFGALTHGSVPWALLRGEDDLARPHGDVDLLVPRDAFARASACFAAAGFTRLPAVGHGSHRFFFAYEENADLWLKLDVVTSLDFGRDGALRTGAADAVLARRANGSLPVLHPDDAFWGLLLHVLLDRGDVPERHARRLAELAPTATLEGPLVHALPTAWPAASAIDCTRAGSWDELLALAPDLKRRWTRKRPLATSSRLASQALARRAAPRGRGLYVALLGPDGTGKSTLAAGLIESFPLHGESVYLGLYSPASPGASGGSLRLASRLAWLARRSAQIRGALARRRLVVSDRHPYDALLDERGTAGRLKAKLLLAALPAPDLTVLLDAPAEVLAARKDEHSAAELEEQRQRYLALQRRRPEIVTVDATQPEDAVRRRVTALAWAAYAGREGSATVGRREVPGTEVKVS